MTENANVDMVLIIQTVTVIMIKKIVQK
ncbi:uncharacterized protein METZ01_LOCUS153952 [marine metagenome]|uniref:Uncharacterized protein n=1 Tax=marine metagenome TaxID=408172 RepID=A0A382AHZ2_9ZZZZ